jgi:hypothetical protein
VEDESVDDDLVERLMNDESAWEDVLPSGKPG